MSSCESLGVEAYSKRSSSAVASSCFMQVSLPHHSQTDCVGEQVAYPFQGIWELFVVAGERVIGFLKYPSVILLRGSHRSLLRLYTSEAFSFRPRSLDWSGLQLEFSGSPF